MRQKHFLIVLLASAILISCLAGVLAIYASATEVAALREGIRSFLPS